MRNEISTSTLLCFARKTDIHKYCSYKLNIRSCATLIANKKKKKKQYCKENNIFFIRTASYHALTVWVTDLSDFSDFTRWMLGWRHGTVQDCKWHSNIGILPSAGLLPYYHSYPWPNSTNGPLSLQDFYLHWQLCSISINKSKLNMIW